MLKSAPGVLFMIYLSLLSMLSFLATDMYLPAFDVIRQDFHATASVTSLSLSLFVGGLALGQLLYGKIAFYKGNRFALLMGLSVFMVASFMTAWVSDAVAFNICRLFQGVARQQALFGSLWL